MDEQSKLLNQIAFNTRPKIEEYMSFVTDKPTHEENLAQPLQTRNREFKIAITFLTAYNGIFNVTKKTNNFYIKKQLTGEDFFQITIPPGAHEKQSLNEEVKRVIIDKGFYSGNDIPFRIKPTFSTLGSIVQIQPQGLKSGFVFDDTIGNLLGFNETIFWEEYKLSPNPVDILSFDKIFIHTDIAQGMIFKGKRSGIIHNFTMDVDLGCKYFEKFRGGVQWFMMDTEDFISSDYFKLKNENGNLVSFNGESITFRLSIREN